VSDPSNDLTKDPSNNAMASIFKAYDIRGVVPEQLNEQVAAAVGAAFAELVDAEQASPSGGRGMVVGYDMRPSSPGLARAFADGAAGRGADVTMIGLASTDELYCASGLLDVPGAMFTASHNPAQYNGIKLCRAGAAPVGQDSGLGDIANAVGSASRPSVDVATTTGSIVSVDMLERYADYLRSLVDLTNNRRLKVVVDAGNGMAGLTAPAVFAGLPLEVSPLYYELDGTFPNHEANPIDPKNLQDLGGSGQEPGGHRPGIRWRRRPLLRDRRAGRHSFAQRAHRAYRCS